MSALVQSLAQDRHAEHYQQTQPSTRMRRRPDDRPTQLSRRSRAGWMRLGLGLRLAVPGRQSAADRITLIGR